MMTSESADKEAWFDSMAEHWDGRPDVIEDNKNILRSMRKHLGVYV